MNKKLFFSHFFNFCLSAVLLYQYPSAFAASNNIENVVLNCESPSANNIIFDRVLNEAKSVDYVIQNLSKANFDPEFFTQYDSAIQKAFQQHYCLQAI